MQVRSYLVELLLVHRWQGCWNVLLHPQVPSKGQVQKLDFFRVDDTRWQAGTGDVGGQVRWEGGIVQLRRGCSRPKHDVYPTNVKCVSASVSIH